MQPQKRWISYDWFKLILALLLAFILLALRLADQPSNDAQANLPNFPNAAFDWKLDADGRSLLDLDGKAQYTLSSNDEAWEPVVPENLKAELPEGYRLSQEQGGWVIVGVDDHVLHNWDAPSLQWRAGEAAGEGNTIDTASEQPASTEIPAAAAEPTATSMPEETTEPAAEGTGDCQPPAPTRLAVGGSARVLSNLNLRSEPLIGNNIVKTNPVGTTLQVLAGPQCVPYQNSAYVWWQVEGPDGISGWSAEAQLNGSAYFMEPVP